MRLHKQLNSFVAVEKVLLGSEETEIRLNMIHVFFFNIKRHLITPLGVVYASLSAAKNVRGEVIQSSEKPQTLSDNYSFSTGSQTCSPLE